MDPGLISPEFYLENYKIEKNKLTNYRICSVCNVIQDLDKGVEHCIDCNVCIQGNDHHCPWSTKCIGYKNLNMFRIFICSLFTHIMYLVVASVLAAVYVDMQRKEKNKKL